MIRTIFFLLITGMITASCTQPQHLTCYIVRHAEKDQATGAGNATNNDPALSEAGKVRALVLKDELKSKHIRYIYSTNTIRARSTAQPLSEEINIPVQGYNTKDSLDIFINAVKKIHKGSVLIVGHSNTVDDIVNKLCNETKVTGDLAESQFDNLFIIKYRGKKIRFERRKYGYPSNPE
jgi:broad specificity phosphatase PhoE